ncbi:serine protease 48-like [Macrosteles quadrilineatus]|uniref:serine protease 48-like n=1 Tax=Macrosteles quadrilineatus TaxID=74068 RepID=UPI0023E10218|nr:serine protease 48-like [Macrosteles quadrilineatus]
MEIQVFSTEICTKWYTFDQRLVEPFGQEQIDREIMFCAGLPQKGRVPCTYDYGGPLQVQEDTPYCMWQVYGVMAWSQSFFCKGSKPPIFTRVPYYLDWIEEVIWYDFNMMIEASCCSDQCTDPLGVPRGHEGRCEG